jgi:hypothetical protein
MSSQVKLAMGYAFAQAGFVMAPADQPAEI